MKSNVLFSVQEVTSMPSNESENCGAICWYLHSLKVIMLAVFGVALLLPVSTVQAEDELTGVSPLYTEYNTFIESSNFLELVSIGSASLSVKVSFYKIDGTFQKAVRVTVPPRAQVDLDVNELVGVNNTYGVVMVEYNNANVNARLQGRMSVYRLEDTDDDFSFAYALPLRAPVTGTTYLTSNTFDPQGRGFVVPNWVSITNLSGATEDFTHTIYDQAGSVVHTDMITLAANERRDLDGSDGSAESVFLNEIKPANPSADYVASVIRYASNTKPTGFFTSYLYAMPIFARAGTSTTQYLPISNRSEECWEQTNWVEVLNVSASTTKADLQFRNSNGTLIDTSSIDLAPRSQFHFNASMMLDLDNAETGVVSVSGDVADSLVTQSVVYFHDCDSNGLQAAYNVPGTSVPEVPLAGSFNRFLNIENELQLYGTTGLSPSVDLRLLQDETEIHSSQYSIPARGSSTTFLNEEMFNTMPDTYGVILIDSSKPYPIMGNNLRMRRIDDAIDFVVPIPIR